MEHTRLVAWESGWRIGVITLTVLFIALAVEITRTHSFLATFDNWFEQALVTFRTPAATHLFTLLTELGSMPFVVSIIAISGISLVAARKYWAYLIGYALTICGSVLTGYLFKIYIARPRPNGIIPILIETSGSFPSGHATISIALYGFLAYLLYVLFPTKRTLIITGTVLLVLTIGFSRLYLGVHFPTDVLAGYMLGSIWLILGVVTVKKVAPKIPPSL